MSNDDFLTEEWVAKFLGLSVKTLKNRRSLALDHPPYIDKGAEAKYPKKEFFAWYLSDLKYSKNDKRPSHRKAS